VAYKKLLQKAIILRKSGYSYSFISNKIGISKSTLSNWLTDIPFVPNHETLNRIGAGKLKTAIRKSKEKILSIEKAKDVAEKDMGNNLSRRDLFMLGLGLYIGEGAKTSNTVRVINSNPQIIRVAMRWFKDVCGLGMENFSLAIHLYPDNNISNSLKFWSKATKVPLKQFGKVQVDLRTKKKVKTRGKLPHGTAHLSVRSNGKKEFGVFLARRIQAWMDKVYNMI